jgi:precorrin-6B methylase 2
MASGRVTAIDRSNKMIEMAARRNREHVAAGRAVLKTAALAAADRGDERFDTSLLISPLTKYWPRTCTRFPRSA